MTMLKVRNPKNKWKATTNIKFNSTKLSDKNTIIKLKANLNTDRKKEYLINIKNYIDIYNLKFVSNSTSGFKIINVYLEG